MKSPVLFLRVLTSIVVVHCSLSGQEGDKKALEYGWRKQVIGGLNLTQTSFDNWTQGGENTLSWQLHLTGEFVRDQEKFIWAQTGRISFGNTKVGGTEIRKSVDEFRLESVFTYKIGANVNPYVAVSGETQLAAGFDYTQDPKVQVSDFMDPGYFTQSVGVGYAPLEVLKTRLGLRLKETITRNFPAPYADDPATPEVEKTRIELGVESVSDFKQQVSESILVTSKLELFSNLDGIDETDVKWENAFSAQVSRYVTVNLYFKVFYDQDLSTKRQWNQGLTLGLTYRIL